MSDDQARLTTASLLNGLRDEDDRHWHRFVYAYGPIVVSWIQKSGISRAEVEDIAQDVFVAAHAGLHNYRHNSTVDGSLRRWLWGITRNKLARYFTNRNETPRAVGGTTAWQAVHQLPDLPFEEVEDSIDSVKRDLASRALQVIKKDFAERTWQAFWQTSVEGLQTRDVADQLEMSSNQVRQSRSRVLRRLREEFGVDVDVLTGGTAKKG